MVQIICDWIILIGAVSVALYNIFKFFLRPTKFFKDKKLEDESKKEEETKKLVKEVLKEELPAMFEERDLSTRDKYLADRQRYLLEIKNEVHNDLKDILEDIKKISQSQAIEIEKIGQSSKDVLRQRIMTIYHEGFQTRSLTTYQSEALEELYKDYKAQKGNSYIDKYYKRMKKWVIIEDEYGDE